MNTLRNPDADRQALERWARAADAWTEHADLLARLTREASAALLLALEPTSEQRLLDLACGPGDPGLSLGAAVGPDGRVICLDATEGMLRALLGRRHASAAGPTAVAAHASMLPFSDSCFDGLSCRFGLMFVARPQAVLHEAARVLRRDGRAVFVVWGAPERNPYFTLPAQALLAAGAPESPTDGPSVFDCQESGLLETLFHRAGFHDVHVGARSVSMHIENCSPDALLPWQARLSGPLADRVRDLESPVVERASQLLGSQVERWSDGNGGLALPAEILVGVGAAP